MFKKIVIVFLIIFTLTLIIVFKDALFFLLSGDVVSWWNKSQEIISSSVMAFTNTIDNAKEKSLKQEAQDFYYDIQEFDETFVLKISDIKDSFKNLNMEEISTNVKNIKSKMSTVKTNVDNFIKDIKTPGPEEEALTHNFYMKGFSNLSCQYVFITEEKSYCTTLIMKDDKIFLLALPISDKTQNTEKDLLNKISNITDFYFRNSNGQWQKCNIITKKYENIDIPKEWYDFTDVINSYNGKNYKSSKIPDKALREISGNSNTTVEIYATDTNNTLYFYNNNSYPHTILNVKDKKPAVIKFYYYETEKVEFPSVLEIMNKN